MTSLVKKVADLLPGLEERGTVYLFAFAEREDIDQWDIVLSSDWSDKDWAGAVRDIAEQLWPRLEPQERSMIARIAVIPSDNPTMQALPISLDGVEPEDNKIVHVRLLGSEIRQAHIFRAKFPPTAASGKAMESVASVHA